MFSESRMLQDTLMNGHFKVGRMLLHDLSKGKRSLEETFDIKKLAMQNAILNLFGAEHNNFVINLRFYYNPITSRLEPIAFDGNSGSALIEYIPFYFLDEARDEAYLKELAYALEVVSKPEYLDELLSENQKELDNYIDILKLEYRAKSFTPENMRNNQKILEQELIRLKRKFNLIDIDIEEKPTITEAVAVELPQQSKWALRNLKLESANLTFRNKNVAMLGREEKNKPAFGAVNDINTNYGSRYRISILAKKTNESDHFGLRIQGSYPSRVDAVFNLDKGEVKGSFITGDFQNEIAEIKAVGNAPRNDVAQ